jgi:hypothetical protein
MLDELSLKSLRLFCLEFADVLYGVSRTGFGRRRLWTSMAAPSIDQN